MNRLLRKQKGNFIVELPLALWLFTMCFLFPMMAIATMATRYTLLSIAAHDAARVASTSTKYIEAKSNAVAAAQKVTSSFSGITEVQTDVILLENQTPYTFNHPVDTDNNVYTFQVNVTAQIDPLINIQGLTHPWQTTITARELCANPSQFYRPFAASKS